MFLTNELSARFSIGGRDDGENLACPLLAVCSPRLKRTLDNRYRNSSTAISLYMRR